MVKYTKGKSKQYIALCLFISIFLIPSSCKKAEVADLILINGAMYTVDSTMPNAEAIAIKNGRILAIGSNDEMMDLKGAETELHDLEGAFVMPGLIEGHGHFSGLGQMLLNLDFMKAKSWDEIVDQVAEAAKGIPEGTWISGRGWHQEKWDVLPEEQVLGYPLHKKLSEAVPNHPVILTHASGHSLYANKKAMELAGISRETPSPSGGEIVKDAQGEPIGVFEERAMQLIRSPYYTYRDGLDQEALLQQWMKGLELAQDLCLSYGITSFQDAGTSFDDLERYVKMAKEGAFRVRLWAMIRHNSETLRKGADKLPVINAGNGYFTCRAIKSELDGALGVFGAWKLKPYDDKPGFVGQNTTSIEELRRIAELAVEKNMQLCVHAIGDRANREFLDMSDSIFNVHPEGINWRWRSEHAQHLDTGDIFRFADLGIIASMQGIHCTSDAPFVVRRLGKDRSRTGAYAWRSLLDAGVIINNGTDAPVESLNPFECLYASVTRKRLDSGEAFFPEQRMTREEAIYSYTMANAYAAFEEEDKGSLSPGKYADITVLDRNILECNEDEIPETKVLRTYVNGKLLYSR